MLLRDVYIIHKYSESSAGTSTLLKWRPLKNPAKLHMQSSMSSVLLTIFNNSWSSDDWHEPTIL